MTLPDPLPIEPIERPFDVAITPPGSKSITCRAFVLAALAGGASRITGALRADDTERLLSALVALGAQARREGADVVIEGVGGRFPRGGRVDLGDGGAPSRFMIAAACLAAEPVTVDGSARMRQRPVAEGIDMLRRLGATIEYLDQDGRLPVRVAPGAPAGGEIEVPTTLSSQFISALLLIAPFLDAGCRVALDGEITSPGYLELTRRVLADWGVPATGPPVLRVEPGAVAGRDYRVEPDASSAVYWMAAAAACGSRVTLPGLSFESAQPDVRAVEALEQVGARSWADEGGLAVQGAARPGPHMDVDARAIPDAAVALAALAAACPGVSVLRGLGTLRIKESDRIAALSRELARIGCTVAADGDRIVIDPASRHEEPVVIETYHDHRMAMAFAALGLARPGIAIRDPACVSKSYPAFWSDLARLYD